MLSVLHAPSHAKREIRRYREYPATCRGMAVHVGEFNNGAAEIYRQCHALSRVEEVLLVLNQKRQFAQSMQDLSTQQDNN